MGARIFILEEKLSLKICIANNPFLARLYAKNRNERITIYNSKYQFYTPDIGLDTLKTRCINM